MSSSSVAKLPRSRCIPVPADARQDANRKGSRIPDGSEQARPAAEFPHTPLAPGQVVGFVARGRQHLCPDFRVAGSHGLSVIQGLGRDLARMIYPHQRRQLRRRADD